MELWSTWRVRLLKVSDGHFWKSCVWHSLFLVHSLTHKIYIKIYYNSLKSLDNVFLENKVKKTPCGGLYSMSHHLLMVSKMWLNKVEQNLNMSENSPFYLQPQKREISLECACIISVKHAYNRDLWKDLLGALNLRNLPPRAYWIRTLIIFSNISTGLSRTKISHYLLAVLPVTAAIRSLRVRKIPLKDRSLAAASDMGYWYRMS